MVLKRRLDEAPITDEMQKETEPLVSLGSALFPVLKGVGLATIKTIFAFEAINSINRTAVFLMTFLLIHCAGNLLIFVGADAFNVYGHLLHVNPLLKVIELYLLLATVIHAGAGMYLTYKKRRFLVKGSSVTVVGNLKLALSSLVVLAFLVIHLRQFKYGAFYEYLSTMDVTLLTESGIETVPKGTPMRDLHKLEKEVFASPLNVWGYVFAITALGAHVWWGWSKSVGKLGVEPKYLPAARTLGQLFITPLIIAFISQPLYVHYFAA